jgi:hypothetical protein
MTDNLALSGRVNDLLRPEVLAAFDRVRFEQQGYWVWEQILTDAGCRQWTASLQRLQGMNDAIVVDTDWGAIDYPSRGLVAPKPEDVTARSLVACCGGSEQMRFQPPGLRDYMYEHGLFGPPPTPMAKDFEWQGMMPEYFPLAYDDFILDVATSHPQMMELFTKLLGARFLLDHVLTLNRPGGSRGRRWHGHGYRQGQHETVDTIGSHSVPLADFLPQQCIRTLCYPEGMSAADGGGELAVVPGAHLYRVPYLWDTVRNEYDDDFEAGWMRGRIHPRTGEPLRIEHLSLPAGSMVSFVHHMPHHVGHRDADAATRWGLLMAYRTPDPSAPPTRWHEGTPAHWAERMMAAGKVTTAMDRVLAGDNATS